MILWLARCVGALTLMLSLVLTQLFPSSLPWFYPGATNPIVAFEFVADTTELIRLFGDDVALRLELLWAMDLGNIADYLFAALYCLWLALSAHCLLPTGRLLTSCYVIAVLVFVADALENWVLLSLSGQLQQATTLLLDESVPGGLGIDEQLFHLLAVATRCKWLGLAVLLVLLNSRQARSGKLALTSLLVALIYGGLAVLVLFDRQWVGAMSFWVAPAFLIVYIRLWVLPVTDYKTQRDNR